MNYISFIDYAKIVYMHHATGLEAAVVSWFSQKFVYLKHRADKMYKTGKDIFAFSAAIICLLNLI